MDELLASLDDRVVCFLRRNDPSRVLEHQALVEVAELLAAAKANGGLTLNVARAVAWLHLARSMAQPAGHGAEDWQTAAEWFELIGKVNPELVPDVFRPGDPNQLARQGAESLGRALRADDPAALDEAIDLLRRAVDGVAADDEDRVGWLHNLSIALRLRAQRRDDLGDLDAAVAAAQEAVDTAGPDHADRPACLSALGSALSARFDRRNVPADIAAAIDALRAAVALAPEPAYLTNLGTVLRLRFDRFDSSSDLDAAITASKAAVDASMNGDPDLGLRLTNLGLSLSLRFDRTGDRADLDGAIAYSRAAVGVTADDDIEMPHFRSNVGIALMIRYHRQHDVADLNEAIAAGESAVMATPPDNPNRALFAGNVGDWLRQRFRRLNTLPDLDDAVAALRESVARTPAGHPDRAGRLHNLGIALRHRYERLGERADGDGAIDAGRAAMELVPDGNPVRLTYLAGLGLAYLARFEQAGDLADIDAAVEAGQVSVAGTPPDHPDRVVRLSDLAGELLTRFYRLGAVRDLDHAIAAGREAVARASGDLPRRCVSLYNLCLALRARFEQGGELADIDAAIDAGRAAVAIVDDNQRGKYLSGLGTALQSRFDHTGDIADIDAAVATGRAAIDNTPVGHPDRALHLSMYGGALRGRFKLTRELSDMDAAVAADREAVDSTPDGAPDRPTYLSNLSAALRTRFAFHGDPADLDAAITASRAAIDTVAPTHAFRARFVYNAGLALLHKDVPAAIRLCQEAATTVSAPAPVRFEAARAWGDAAANQGWWAAAADGYAQAVALLPLLAWVGTGRRSRELLVTDWGRGLAGNAAACAIAAGQPDRAVALLEQGRGVLWSQLLETRTDLAALRQARPDLADELAHVRAELDRPDGVADERVAAGRRWTGLLDEVRALPGFAGFARPPDVAELRAAARGGTVVMINVSRWRCDALLVTESGVRVLPLPGLTEDDVVEHVNAYLGGIQDERAISATLAWLWDAVAEPVLTALGHRDMPTGDWPRVWWCPIGPLTIVPLHAAGHHDVPGRSVLDRVVSSYAPTLRALSVARTRPPATGVAKLLLIALPNTPGAPLLPHVAREQAFLADQFDHTLLAGADATRDNVLAQLGAHTWAHAACHGHQNMADPSTGGLMPYDWPTAGLVSVLDMTLAEHAGEFAFLSACQTATGGIAGLDEAINLAAALHYAGWRRVVGTLWSVWDDAAAQVTRDTYRRLITDGRFDPTRAAEALHHAVRAGRDGSRDKPSRWAPFLHTGP